MHRGVVKDHSKKYRAFISYSHADQKWGRWLHRALESYRTPKHLPSHNVGTKSVPSRLTPIFRDREEFASSHDLSERINTALTNSESLIVICSPHAARSRWVNQEIEAFKKLGRSKKIYCLIVSGDPGNPGAENDCFPPMLRIRFDEQGKRAEGVAEPIAADARKQIDGKKIAFLKLVAGLLDVGFDDLRQRELQRRNQRLVVIAASSLAATVVTITLTVNAVIARNDAVEARKEAEQRRAQAESLISFMLGDLRKRLQPVGRLDVLDGVGQQALEYFSSLTESELTSDTMLIRATALRQIGEVRVAQGLISEGLVAFNEALELLNNSSVENEALRLFELGQVNYWIADAYFNDLQLTRAQEYVEKYLDISRDLVQLEPNNPDYQLELLYAESNLGTLALRANELSAAREYFSNALDAGRNIATLRPGDDNDVELATTLSWLAAVDETAGKLSASLGWYDKQLALRRTLMEGSTDPSRKHSLGRVLYLRAGIQTQVGKISEAIRALDESVELYRELVAYDPQNFAWQLELAWSLATLAREKYAVGDLTVDDARALLALADEAISKVDQDNTAEISRVYAAIYLELGRIELFEGQPVTALDLSQLAVQRLTPFISGNDRIRILPLYARASYIATEAALASGDEMQSIKLAKSAVDNLNLQDYDTLEVQAYAALLAFRSHNQAANDLLATISQSEYRAVVYIPNTEAERWWDQGIGQSTSALYR
jgi:tetratricopeptide (TPR) repeat protein